jgi:hypothetical protein
MIPSVGSGLTAPRRLNSCRCTQWNDMASKRHRPQLVPTAGDEDDDPRRRRASQAPGTSLASTAPPPRRRGSSCCPLLFERASTKWWSPQFDSQFLETQYWKSSLPRTTKKFQFGLAYLLGLCLMLAVYFPVTKPTYWPTFLGTCAGCICPLKTTTTSTTTTTTSSNRDNKSIWLFTYAS